MFTFDDTYVYTWELKKGQLVRPLRLKIFKLTGQIISTPLQNFGFFNHSSIVLGYDANSYLKTVYVCGKTQYGYEISPLKGGLRTNKLSFDPGISGAKCLARLARFLNTRQYRFNSPAYNVTISNCQNFSHAIVYDGDIHVAITVAVFVFVVVFFWSK